MPEQVRVIEWQDLDKRRFYLIGPAVFFGIRALMYPPNLIKTRLQVQRKQNLYTGMVDAFRNTFRSEGVRGLYRGFLISNFSVLSGQIYITTYELVRQRAQGYNPALRGFLAGCCASVVGQSVTVPVDIVTQKLMVAGQGGGIGRGPPTSALAVIREIVRDHGPRGFYNGFFISLLTYGPTSGTWWAAYGTYLGVVSSVVPQGTPHIVIQGISGPLAGLTAATVTIPLDVVRTRLQVEARHSVIAVFQELVREEGFLGLTKGLSARIANMMPSSLLITLGYETIKRLSLKQNLTDSSDFKNR